MSAFRNYLRRLGNEKLWGDMDYYMAKCTNYQGMMQTADAHIGELETELANKDQRIADLEALFEPFLKNFLKSIEGDPWPD